MVAKFLYLKQKQVREKKLWNKQKYVNEYFSEETRELCKELLKNLKEVRERGENAAVVHNKIVMRTIEIVFPEMKMKTGIRLVRFAW